MPRKKKHTGAGAVVKVLLRYIHPSVEIRSKYVNPDKGERLYGCVVLKKGIKVVNRKDQAVIIFCHEEFENTKLYAVSRYVAIEEEGPSTEFFNDEDNGGVDEEAVENTTVVCEEVEYTSIRDAITLIDHLRVGGEVEATEFQNAGLTVDNDNDPLPENLPRTSNSNTDNECTYQDWGHNGIYHRKNAINNNTLPQLKVTKPTDFNYLSYYLLQSTLKKQSL